MVFPYPVAPDLLLASSPDGSLMLEAPTAPAESATAAPSESAAADDGGAEGDEDVIIPAFEDEEEEEEEEGDGQGDTDEFWTPPRYALAFIAFIVVVLIAYFVYQSYTGAGNGKNSNGSGNAAVALANGTAPSLTPPANDLGTLAPNDFGDVDTFGDGFNDFANVGDIGPPPPTGR